MNGTLFYLKDLSLVFTFESALGFTVYIKEPWHHLKKKIGGNLQGYLGFAIQSQKDNPNELSVFAKLYILEAENMLTKIFRWNLHLALLRGVKSALICLPCP